MDYKIIKETLTKSKNIVVTTHKSPDGDALGSALGLYHILKVSHNIQIIVPNQYPYYLSWMPGAEDVIVYEGNEVYSDKLIAQSDLIFCLDFNKLHRLATMHDVILNNKSYKIMIDHHQEPDDFCDQILSDSSIASTAELVYDFLLKMNLKLNKKTAICLYTGIVTAQTHKIVSNLMSFNISHYDIHRNLFEQQNHSRIKLLSICLNNIKIYKKQYAALTFLTEKDLLDCNYQKGDTEGFVNFPLSLKGIIFSTLFIEFKDGIKISFRSQGDFDVNLFAKKYFNGGGHKNAAGGFIDDKNMLEAIDYFSNVIYEFTINL